jgi:hypothetical protein
MLLADDMEVELSTDFRGSRQMLAFGLIAFLRFGGAEFFVENRDTEIDAFVANVHAGTSDKLFDFRVSFSAEGTHG